MKPSTNIDDGATAVITHRVHDGHKANYEQWLLKIVPLCKTYPGYLDWQVIKPIAKRTHTYTVIIRFDTHKHLLGWLDSADRKHLIDEARAFLADDNVHTQTGLDFLFIPEGGKTKAPKRWKQYLVTWAAIYPLSILSQLVFAPTLQKVGVPDNRYLKTFILSAILVYLMIFVVMPRLTKLVKNWLYT